MAILSLSDTQSRTDFLRRRAVANLQFWLDYVTANTTEPAALDRERETVIKAISLGFNVESAWPLVEELVVSFSRYMERSGHWEAWNGIVRQALEVARDTGDIAAQINLSGLLARLLKRQSRFQEAIRQHHQTIRLARQIGDRYNEARAWTNMGFLYIEEGQWHRAEVICCHALKIFEALDSMHGRAHTENHLGLLYTRQWRWELAEARLQRACALWQIMGDSHGLMFGFTNMGLLYNEMEQPAQALQALNQALQQAKNIGEETEVGVIYLNIAYAYTQLDNPQQAETYARLAETNFNHISNWLYLPAAWVNLGKALLAQGKWEQAHSYLQAALDEFKRLAYKYGEINAVSALIDYELAQNNQAQAEMRFNDLKRLISQYDHTGHQNHLERLLKKYHRSLKDNSLQATVAAVKQI